MNEPRKRAPRSQLAIQNNELRMAIKTVEHICNKEFDRLNTRIIELEAENASLKGAQ